MWLGIDFGTTNTSAAVYDGSKLTYIPLDPLDRRTHNLRSMIYIDSAQRVRLGLDAVQTFLREDTGRPVILEEKVVGTIENTVARQGRSPLEPDGPITIVYDVVLHDDVGVRGRLLQSIKTALRSPTYAGTQVFDTYYTVEELIGLILGHVRRRSEQFLHKPIDRAVVGRPVTFAHDAAVDAAAEAKLRRAAELAGFAEVVFVPEPVAAAAFYVQGLTQDVRVLIFDFGGGTLDLTVLEATADGAHRLLASTGVLVGGDDLDRALMRGKVAPHFGTESAIDTNFDGRPIPFPDSMTELLEQWQTIPVLTRPQYLPVIQRGVEHGEDPAAFAALETLVTKNYGFALFQAIEQAKCVLSQDEQATIALQLADHALAVDVARAEFNQLISQEKAEVRRGIRQVIAASGVRAEQIDVVALTGGSSSIPIFHRLLQTEVPNARLVVSNRFGSTTGGLALYAHQRAQGEAVTQG